MTLPRFNEVSYAHFVTTKTFRNKKIFNDTKCCDIALRDIDFYRKKLGFKLLGYCIVPDHLHLIVWWDVDKYFDLTISKVMHGIKGRSAKRISNYLLSGRRGFHAPSLERQGIKALPTRDILYRQDTVKIWQPSFYDFNIYTEQKLHQKLNYIHWNPARARLCAKPGDWPWSSYQFYESGEVGKIGIDILY
ncbi:MAG: transposase [Parcubacteria group bacterium]